MFYILTTDFIFKTEITQIIVEVQSVLRLGFVLHPKFCLNGNHYQNLIQNTTRLLLIFMRGILCLIFTNLNSIYLIYIFNDTPRYLDDILIIDYPEFEKHIPDIYPMELQLNKANTSDKETVLHLNIKVIERMFIVHTRVYGKREYFGFPIVIFPWSNGDVLWVQSYGVYIPQLVKFARCCTSVLDFSSNNLQITSNYWHRVTEKKEEFWLSVVTKTPTPTEKSKKQRDNIKTPTKTLITQRLRTNLRRSVGVTVVTQLVWLNRFTSAKPSH